MTQAILIQSCLHERNIMGALKHAEMWVIQERENPEAWFWRGTVQAAGQLDEAAIESWETALKFMPDHRGASHNLTLGLMKQGHFQKAKTHLLKLEALLPQDGQTKAWLGHVYSALSEQENALSSYKEALKISGKDPQIFKLAAMCARDLGHGVEALSLLNQALDIAPNDASLLFERGCIQLALGKLKEGFDDYESRWQRDGMKLPKLPMPLWTEENLKGKHILLHDEQGIGDTIMFSRFALTLLGKGAKVTYWVRPHLQKLLQSLNIDIIVCSNPDLTADYHCPIMSLPYKLNLTSAKDLSMKAAYLHPQKVLMEKWSDKLLVAGDKNKIGLIWQGDPKSQAEKGRSQSFENYRPHLKPGNHYFILQCLHGREELADVTLPENVTDLGGILDQGKDAFLDTAAVMAQLDQIITTDTGPAHLAGALNIPTHLLLQKTPEWRWGNEGSKSHWYPSMTLFRDDLKAAFM